MSETFDPPFTTEFSIANLVCLPRRACRFIRTGMTLALTTDVLAPSGIIPVRMGLMREAHPCAPAETATMTGRTTETVVSFSFAFLLPGLDAPQPPGDYRVDHDEEPIEGLSRLAWQRVGTFIHLPGIGRQGATHQMVPISPADLDAALEKDRNQS